MSRPMLLLEAASLMQDRRQGLRRRGDHTCARRARAQETGWEKQVGGRGRR